ncbi:hypothetical protein QJQ45_016747 [Haematococcus lacustris]|nr:hypothetical protein QJQ45_016747 [Haematococcus lacustris]
MLPDDVLCRILEHTKAVDPKLHRSLATTCRNMLKASLHDEPCITVRWQAGAPDAPLLPTCVRDLLQTRSKPLSLIVTKVAIRNDEGRFIRAATSSSGVLAAVEHLSLREACRFTSLQQWPLACTDLLATNYPGLTKLSLSCSALTVPALHSLLSHPQLSQRLRQLCLDHVALAQGGPAWQETLFTGSQLAKLTLLGVRALPSLAPLASHLTHLTLHLYAQSLTQALTSLSLSPRLRVLIADGSRGSGNLDQAGLQQLLRDLPNLQELVLPHVVVSGMQTLDALLAATQLTRLNVQAFTDLAESRAEAWCSWRYLEVACGHEEQPLLGLGHCRPPPPAQPGAATFSWQGFRFNALICCYGDQPTAAAQPLSQPSLEPGCGSDMQLARRPPLPHGPSPPVVQQLVQLGAAVITVQTINLSASVHSLQALAPLCQSTKTLAFSFGRLSEGLEFWTTLQQLLPCVECVHLWEVGCCDEPLVETLRELGNLANTRPLCVRLGRRSRVVGSQTTLLGRVTLLATAE